MKNKDAIFVSAVADHLICTGDKVRNIAETKPISFLFVIARVMKNIVNTVKDPNKIEV